MWFGTASDGAASRTRGACISQTTGNVLVVTEPNTGDRTVRVLARADGTEVRQLNTETATIGLYQVNMIVSADDGVIYACNLDAPAPDNLRPRLFRILRWENDSTEDVPVIAFGNTDEDPESGDPAGVNVDGQTNSPQRWGDSFDVLGSGTATILAAGTRASDAIALFTTTDGIQFTPHFVTGVAAGAGSHSIALGERLTGFDDPSTPEVESIDAVTVYSKLKGSPLRRAVIRLDTFAIAGTVDSYSGGSNPPAAAGPIGTLARQKLMGAIEFFGTSAADEPNRARLFSYGDPAQFTEAAPGVEFTFNQFNSNFVGSVDFYEPADGNPELLFLDAANVIALYELTPAPVPPEVTGPPATLSIIEGGYGSIMVGATGSTPLTYQWIHEGVELEGQTGSVLTIANADEAKTGSYSCRVSNSAGEVTSGVCTVSLLPRVQGDVLTKLWEIAPESRPYVNTDGTQRSITWNPALNHLLVFSRSTVPGEPSPLVVALDPDTGAEILDNGVRRTLAMRNPDDETADVSGGTFPLNQIGAAADGAIYGCNLVTGADAGNFKVYRWSNGQAGTLPQLVFGPENVLEAASAEGRLGDTMAVRGAGPTTQILLGARNQEKFVILTTADGATFQPVVYEVTGTSPQAFFQVAFGEGNTIWAKQEAGPVRRISFDPTARTATVDLELDTAVAPAAAGAIGVSPVRNLLGAVTRENPDSFRLVDTGDPLANPPVPPAAAVDQEFFPADNANENNTGSVAFSTSAVFALSTNNGIVAWRLPELPVPESPPVITDAIRAGTPDAPAIRFTLTGDQGAGYTIESAINPAAGPWATVETIVLTGTSQDLEYSAESATSARFFRATKTQP